VAGRPVGLQAPIAEPSAGPTIHLHSDHSSQNPTQLTLADHRGPTNLQRRHPFRHSDDCYTQRCWYFDPFWHASGSWDSWEWRKEIAESRENWDGNW